MISFSKLIEIVNFVNSDPEVRIGRESPRSRLLSLLRGDIVNDNSEFIVVKTRIKVGRHSHVVYVYLKVSNNIVTIEHVSAYPAKVTESLVKQREVEQRTKQFKEILTLVSKLPA